MTQPNFNQMTREELRAYILEHRNDDAALHTYMDRLASEPALAQGSDEDLQDPIRFANSLEQVRKLKQEQQQHE